MLSVQCGFHLLTGLQCPGCGGQRAFHHILHGEVLTALRYNSVLVLGLPFLAYMYYVIVQVHILKSNKFNNSFIYSAKFGYTVLVVLAVFWIIRNIPIMPFIYLSPPS
ncbi:MAG: DUF2752 domain-containing protein [Dysgonomonas sp.]